MSVDIEELKRKAEAATAGEWRCTDANDNIRVREEGGHQVCEIKWNSHDGPYIAAANPSAILAIADEVESLRKQVEEVTQPERRFPMQRGPSIPWSLAEVIYAGYAALYGTQQSLKRLAERGGFSWKEVEIIYNDRNPAARAAMDAAQLKEQK